MAEWQRETTRDIPIDHPTLGLLQQGTRQGIGRNIDQSFEHNLEQNVQQDVAKGIRTDHVYRASARSHGCLQFRNRPAARSRRSGGYQPVIRSVRRG
ncbi:hypothetical protein [Arthrobacter sp. Bi83]|uniref:hypothetical protein n=1 Tax=Arthrobacter sp. Bi83 TaxID=2822353 RepID=UPI001E469528|nr:hypothetical protein [Arthrobacter sp. Bi83]